ncbi:hypothetical protein LTR37_019718 [Vermiconidia calcicola]|uniref:Uncharacterized protein n=1 Tax=Vermiconidia calcicola TaxID=1690605 RepID=A0ACC3MDD1_9PEZI|nr:hypothetical protein LTR37_019718 [Vermiconidia calcicola]
MAIVFEALLCLLLVLAGLTPVCSIPQADLLAKRAARTCTYQGPPASKRWYSVEDSDENTDLKQEGKSFAWPVKCSGPPSPVQPVRYCFKDKRSKDNLKDILDSAISRWGPAMQEHVSALSIDLDAHDPEIYCDNDRVSDDALVISDETKEGAENDDWNWYECNTQSTTGYDYSSDARGRHTLEFCHFKPDDREGTRKWAIRGMMHELGHVIGLQHEHQRPDRGQYLWYQPKNLDDYEDAKERADIDEYCLWEDDVPIEQRMKEVTQIETFAQKYFPQALDFITATHRDGERWESYTHSTEFDYESIMLYPSNTNTIGNKFVIWRKSGGAVWQGGYEDPTFSRVSKGDIARVCQLYPSGTEEGREAQDPAAWGGAEVPLVVRMAGGFETVIYAPNMTMVGSGR